LSAGFSKVYKIDFSKIFPEAAEVSMGTDGQRDMTKLMVAFLKVLNWNINAISW